MEIASLEGGEEEGVGGRGEREGKGEGWSEGERDTDKHWSDNLLIKMLHIASIRRFNWLIAAYLFPKLKMCSFSIVGSV